MNLDKLTFIVIASGLVFGFFRCVFVQLVAWNYMRKNHYDFWLEHVGGASVFGGPSVFNQSKELGDPKMEAYATQFHRNLKQLLIIVALSVLIAMSRIALKEFAGV